ncbi:MAG: transferase [Dethiosulfovibrio peptidovorans]|nr:MAG: transferase [Dethiosulfovibrio peptidovorans]
MSSLYVLGAGGHGKVVVATLQAMGRKITAILDDDQTIWGTSLWGIPISGPLQSVEDKKTPEAIIAVGINSIRRDIAQRITNVRWIAAIHPSATVHPSVTIGVGSVIFAGAVIQPDTALGKHVIVNTGVTIDHDCRLGSFVHVAPGAHLAGTVSLEDGVLMGIGSSAIPGVSVGAWTTVGAGAAVVSDLPRETVAVGVPAKILDQTRT